MSDTITYAVRKEVDPTHTTLLRNAFAQEMRKRFNELMRVIKTTVYDRDAFGLTQVHLELNQMYPSPQNAFNFARNQAKLDAFMVWLRDQVDRGILTTTQMYQLGSAVEKAWTDLYLLDSYKRGVERARYEMKQAGYDVPSVEMSGGIEIIIGTPFHIDRIGLIFSRVYEELKGVTAAMDQQISRVLAQGLADGDNPRLLARKLVSTINGDGVDKLGIRDSLGRFIPASRRAELLARTEIIRAHHLATVQEYKNWRIEGVFVNAELVTAGDDRVCEKCSSLEGHVFTLEEAEGLIPRHPLCRCCIIPVHKELG